MKTVQIEIPQDILLSLKMPQTIIKEWLTQELAVSLYAQGYLSFGKARKLAGLSKWEFAEQLGKREIPRHYTEEDVEEDLRFAHEG
jgi:predicted HTH domain antitoxin